MTTQKWYKLFLWLTILSLSESLSNLLLKPYISLPQGFGIISLVIGKLLGYLFGYAITGWVILLFKAWFIWAVVALYFQRKLKKLKPKDKSKPEKPSTDNTKK